MVGGPNGSGKTTLLRTVALNVILTQIGCRPLCASFSLTPIHFIFSFTPAVTSDMNIRGLKLEEASALGRELASCRDIVGRIGEEERPSLVLLDEPAS